MIEVDSAGMAKTQKELSSLLRMCDFPEKGQYKYMATEYIALPGTLLRKIKEAAAKEDISPEELVRDAVEERINRSEWVKTLEFGDRNARMRGLWPEDVEAELRAVRHASQDR